MAQGLREALTKAMDEGTVAPIAPEIDADQPVDAAPVEVEAAPVETPEATPSEKARTPDGKFAPKGTEAPTKAPEAAKPEEAKAAPVEAPKPVEAAPRGRQGASVMDACGAREVGRAAARGAGRGVPP